MTLADIGRADLPMTVQADPLAPPVWGSGGTGFGGFGTAVTVPGAPTASTFTGQAPTPTTFADFTAPNPADVLKDPTIQWQLDQSNKALARSALSRGTFLTGDTAKALAEHSQNFAGSKYQDLFDRAMSAYNTNRATNAQNFGQSMDAFTGNLGAFTANTNAGLGWGELALSRDRFGLDQDRFGLDATLSGYDRGYQASRDAVADQSKLAALEYARQVEDARRAQQAQAAIRPAVRPRQWWDPSRDVPTLGSLG